MKFYESYLLFNQKYILTFTLIFKSNNLSTMNLGAPEIILIALIVLLLFGGKKIPELMKGLGKGVSSFKKGLKDIEDDIKSDTSETNK